MRLSSIIGTVFASAIALAACVQARADGPVSVSIGPQFITQGTARDIAGSTQTDLGVGYDFGPPKIALPVRFSLQADDAFGSSGAGHLGVFGAGLAARLTTPLYAGVGVSLYDVNLHENFADGTSASSSTVGAGTSLYVGSKLFSLPGIGLSIEGSYKTIPSLAGVNPSAYGIGLRANI